jgi:uncharacterized protein (TIGR02246 family)
MERSLVSDVAKINGIWKAYATALNSDDLEGWLSLWMANGICMAPGAPRLVGLDQIQELMEGVFRRFELHDFKVQADEIRILGDQAYSHGQYTARLVPRAGGEPIKIDGKFLTILAKQVDGLWKIAVDCFNSNLPSTQVNAA